jgi:hypothetical protein
MKRYTFVLLFIGLLMGLLPAHPTAAHGGIAIDGNASDWGNLGNGSCPTAPAANSGQVLTLSHTDCGLGANAGTEYVWTDASGDQRTDHWSPTGNMDLTQLRITGDANNLYFLLRFSDITSCNAQYIAIAIDSTAGGTTFFPDSADTNLPWGYERVVVANTNKTGYFTNDSTFTAAGTSFCSDANNLWEISIPRADLGLTWPAVAGDYDFAVMIACHNGTGGICDAFSSDAMDVVTVAGDTWSEVSDGALDYSFTMGFSPTAVTLSQQHATPVRHTLWVIATSVLLLALATQRRLRQV